MGRDKMKSAYTEPLPPVATRYEQAVIAVAPVPGPAGGTLPGGVRP